MQQWSQHPSRLRIQRVTDSGNVVHYNKFLTHSLLSLPLVGLHFQLQLVHQILKSDDVLLVLLSLQLTRIHD